MKVIGIKGNYDNNEKAEVFLMADSSLLKDGKPLFLPDFAESFVAYPAFVLRINRLGKNISKRFAHRYYDAVTIGLCIEAQGIKNATQFSGSGSIVNAFDGAAVIGDFIPVESIALENQDIPFCISVNGNIISEQNINCLDLDIDSIIEELSKYFTFKIGDILFTGFKKDSGFKLNINDTITGKIVTKDILYFKVK